MATIGYTIMDNLYAMSDDFDLPVSMLLQDMANFADQIEKNLNDGVSRTKDEQLAIYKEQLDEYADSSAKFMELTDDELMTIHEVVEMAVDI